MRGQVVNGPKPVQGRHGCPQHDHPCPVVTWVAALHHLCKHSLSCYVHKTAVPRSEGLTLTTTVQLTELMFKNKRCLHGKILMGQKKEDSSGKLQIYCL